MGKAHVDDGCAMSRSVMGNQDWQYRYFNFDAFLWVIVSNAPS